MIFRPQPENIDLMDLSMVIAAAGPREQQFGMYDSGIECMTCGANTEEGKVRGRRAHGHVRTCHYVSVCETWGVKVDPVKAG